ncbi:MAG: CHASE2 domain-containing protein, partial [Geminicoccaceae bacterium]|nr:CHASE2 domain-containing protein [Geminicoccaceae bacterium]
MRASAAPVRRTLAAGIGAATLVGLAGLGGLLERLDLPLRDAATARAPPPSMPDIVLVEIDEAALSVHGRWPWPRRLLAELLDRIVEGGPRAIGLAVLLLDPDPADPEGDARLIEAVARAEKLVLPILAAASAPGGLERERLPAVGLAAAAAGLGHVEVPVDRDGLTQGVFPRAGLDGGWPAFALCLEAV